MQNIKDIFIIGGGINGTGIAADAAGRGLSVALCEQGDLASGTSSASTKLIHGGLRYLEFYEFNLVRKALQEREILIKKAPHLTTPLEFVLPYENHFRPAWMIRCGMYLYDHLAKRTLIPGSKQINFSQDIRGNALQNNYRIGFSYYDCATDDARLVIENALVAKEKNADILTHTKLIAATREDNYWKITLSKQNTITTYYAKVLINTAGPWVTEANNKIQNNNTDFAVQLVKGSHIVVPKLYEGDFAYILQNEDKRIIFTIPYKNNFTLIGTTDIVVAQPTHNMITEDEINYLCHSVNQYFKTPITAENIVWSYAGVRCLQSQHANNPSKTTRDYKILITDKNTTTPLLTVIGGKITTFRILAENAVNQLKKYLPHMQPAWTATTPLPGGDFKQSFSDFCLHLQKDFNWLPKEIAEHYAKTYGTRAYSLLANTHNVSQLGSHFGNVLYQKEIDFLIKHEWATSAEDILWRRTKLGLVLTANEVNRLEQYILTS